MQNQKTISSFFSASGTKRTADDAGVNTESPQSKSAKCDTLDSKAIFASSLSPEQKERMETNRRDALRKLKEKKSPKFVGASWKIALEAEFNKDYFLKVLLEGTFHSTF